MLQIFQLTISKVAMMMVFIAIGYVLRWHHDLPDDAGTVLSMLLTRIISPAYTINSLSKSLTMDVVGEKALLLGYGTLFVFVAIGLAKLLAKFVSKSRIERSSLTYAFAIPNYGYFGYPIVEGVFGTPILADMMIFAIPLSFATSSYGYSLFMTDRKLRIRQVLFTPMVFGVVIGAAIGLSGITLPRFVNDALSGAAACMSPCSMLLAGFMLGKFPLKQLISDVRPYMLSGFRLIGIPFVYGIILLLCRAKGTYLLLPMLVASLPLGLNLVVYPESLGHEREASENAKLCFISYLMALVVLPFSFALFAQLAI